MKTPSAVLLIMALGLAVVAVAVYGMNDRSTFVSPPEAVVEDVSRKLARHRYALVRASLSRAARAQETPERLEVTFRPVGSAIGAVDNVAGETDWISANDAQARAQLKGSAGSAVLVFRLKRENGLWVVDEWSWAK